MSVYPTPAHPYDSDRPHWRVNPRFQQRPVTSRTLVQFTKDRLQNRLKNVKRVQFAIIFVICLSILVVQMIQCVEKLLKADTGTADKYVHLSNVSFPVLTVCPTYPYKLDKLQEHGIETKTQIQFKAKWVSSKAGVSPTHLYNDVVMKIDEIIRQIDLFAEVEIDGKNVFSLKPTDKFCDEPLFYVKQYYYNGDCFALDLPKCLKESGVLEIVMDFYNKTDIFIHHWGQFLSPNSRSRVDVELGQFVKIAINHEVVQLLGTDGNCVNDYGEDQNFDGCIYRNLRDLNLNDTGCTVPWLPDKSKICTDPEKSTKAFSMYQKNRRNQNDICPGSCLFTNMYFGPPVRGMQNSELSDRARAVFYFRRDIKFTNEYRLYSLLSMLAEIGGYVGLLLGVSLFKLAAINNFFIDFWMERKGIVEEDFKKGNKINIMSWSNKY